VIDLLDLELEEPVIVVDRVCSSGTHPVDSPGYLECPASHQELVVTRAGKAMQDTAGFGLEVAPLG
jgi:hypothetical protein